MSITSDVALQWINFCAVAQKHLISDDPCKEDLLIVRIAEYIRELEQCRYTQIKEIAHLTAIISGYSYAHDVNASRNLSQEQMNSEIIKSLLKEKKEENV